LRGSCLSPRFSIASSLFGADRVPPLDQPPASFPVVLAGQAAHDAGGFASQLGVIQPRQVLVSDPEMVFIGQRGTWHRVDRV